MAAIFEWQEDTGAQTGSPLKGTTRNTAVTQLNSRSLNPALQTLEAWLTANRDRIPIG